VLNVRQLLSQESQLVDALDQTMPGKTIDRKLDLPAVR
jgi:hypothetical protein